jgi:SAM-dependent methyltransferase
MDWITAFQSAYTRLRSHWMFSFRPEIYDWNGRQPDPLRDKQTRWGMRLGTRLFSRVYPGVPGRVHIHDSMLQNDGPEEIAHYLSVGLSAMENIEATLAAAGRRWDQVESILDMACGYGRVLRHLALRRPGRLVTACEVMPEAIRFCSEEFGAKPLLSVENLDRMTFPGRYDLIWVGSLLTHLKPDAGMALAAKLAATLQPGGLLVFSAQGPSCLKHIPFYGFVFEDKSEEFARQFAKKGTAYLPYFETAPDYGIALLSEAFVKGEMARRCGPQIEFLRCAERGWDAHQDVWSFRRAGSPTPSK